MPVYMGRSHRTTDVSLIANERGRPSCREEDGRRREEITTDSFSDQITIHRNCLCHGNLID